MTAVEPTSRIVLAAAEGSEAVAPALLVALALGLAVVHLFAGRLRLLDRVPRSRWLSGAGGASVAYVFVHLFPELREGAEVLAERETLLAFADHHVYLVALAGFVTFYGLERLLKSSDRDPEDADGLFWLHVGSFALYNGLVGYALHHRVGATAAALFALAMGLHFLVNDVGLREHHRGLYDRVGRWLLAAAVPAGLAVGFLTEVSEATFVVAVSFLGGGIVLNVIKEELPEERESRFGAFLVGVVGYTALLLLA